MTNLDSLKISILDPQGAAPNRKLAGKTRRAISLVELTVSMVTGSILIAGMTASVLMSQRSLNHLRTYLREATEINMTDPSVWSVVVPDRNNDGINESIQYRLPAATSTISRNAWSTEIFYPNNNLVHIMRDKPSTPVLPSTPGTNRVVIEGVSTNATNDSASSLTVNCPGTSNVNDMQIAILATGSAITNLAVQGKSWVSIYSTSYGTLRLAIWARLVNNDSSNIVFTGTGGDRLSGCVIRVSGHDDTIVIDPTRSRVSTATVSPISLGQRTWVANELHFRVLVATGNNITQNFTGLSRNNCLAMITSGTSGNAIILGVGSQVIATPTTPGSPATLNFSLTANASTLTIPFTIPPPN